MNETESKDLEYGWRAHPSNIPELHKAAFMAIETLAIMADHIATPQDARGREPDEFMIKKCINTITKLTQSLGI